MLSNAEPTLAELEIAAGVTPPSEGWLNGSQIGQNPETSVLSQSVHWQHHLANVAKLERVCRASHCH